MSLRRAVWTGTTALLLGLAACDSGPGGPGTVSGTVTGDAQLGAAVLDVTWRGVTGFHGLGTTQVYAGPVGGSADRYRVVLVDAQGGDLRFSIEVDDVYLEGPVATIVAAAGTDNLERPVGTLELLLER